MSGLSRVLPAALLALTSPSAFAHTQQPFGLESSPKDPSQSGFLRNEGQWPERVRFAWRGARGTVWLERDGVLVVEERQVSRERVDCLATRLTILGADQYGAMCARRQLSSSTHFFLGDPGRWRTAVASFEEVALDLPHCQLVFTWSMRDASVHLALQEGSESDLRLVFSSGDAQADKHLEGMGAVETLRRLLASVNPCGDRPRNPMSEPDLGLDWSSFIGGSAGEGCRRVAVMPGGDVVVVGSTGSWDYPTTTGAYSRSLKGNDDGFVTRVTSDGRQVVYSTYIGGVHGDYVRALGVDDLGQVTIAGETRSPDYPTTPNAYDTTPHRPQFNRVFVTRLSPDGRSLVYSTFIGKDTEVFAFDLALYPDRSVVVVGSTGNGAWPTTPSAYKRNPELHQDEVFVTRLNAAGSALMASTLLGAWHPVGHEFGDSVAVDGAGGVVVAGRTKQAVASFPTTVGAYDRSHNGGEFDIFVSRLDATFSVLQYSTLLGGAGVDDVRSMVVARNGSIVVSGNTTSTNFPTTPGVVGERTTAKANGYVARLDPTLSRLEVASFITPAGASAYVGWMGLDGADAVHIVGNADGSLPVTKGARDMSFNGGVADAYVMKLSGDMRRHLYVSYLGGAAGDQAHCAAFPGAGCLVVAGETYSRDFPTTRGSFQRAYSGLGDGFVLRERMLPAGVARFGRSSRACYGEVELGVTAAPQVGIAGFGLTCTGARPYAWGHVLLGVDADYAGIPLFGALLYVPPVGLTIFPFIRSNAIGVGELPMAMPAGARGMRFFVQCVWPVDPACSKTQILSASDALEVTVR